jgi:hypothetical protein
MSTNRRRTGEPLHPTGHGIKTWELKCWKWAGSSRTERVPTELELSERFSTGHGDMVFQVE